MSVVVALFATLGVGASVFEASASPVGAESNRLAACEVTGVGITLVPGFSSVYGKGTFTTHGPSGTLECRGFIQGREVTGPGTFAEEGVYEGDCSGGTAASTISVVLQTADGPVTASFPVKINIKPGWGWKTSDALIGPLTYQYYPTRGDCLTTPVTEVVATGQGLVKS
jgi:hypothetical protein